jgi:hypothetical protein
MTAALDDKSASKPGKERMGVMIANLSAGPRRNYKF